MVQRLNWEDLKYFNAVAQTLSIRRAAERNKISPATLSRRVVNLEERLGDSLFVRKANRLSLTPLGQEILFQVQQVQSKVDFIETRCGIGDGLHKIRVRSPSIYTRTHLIPLIQEVSVRLPRTTFIINCNSGYADLEPELDDILISAQDCNDPAYERSALQPVELQLYRAKNVEFNGTIVLWKETGPDSEFLNSKLREILPEARGVVVVDGEDAYLDAIAQGLGVGMICAKAAQRFPHYDRLTKLPYRTERRMWVYRRKDAQPASVVRQITKQILARDAQLLTAPQIQTPNSGTHVSD